MWIVCFWGLTWKSEVGIRFWFCHITVIFTHELQKAYSCGSCRFVTWTLDCFKVWRILTESDVCLSGRAERKHLARRRLEFFSLLLSSVILCHPHSLVSAIKSLSSVRNVCVLVSGVTLCPRSPGDSGICVLRGGRNKKWLSFLLSSNEILLTFPSSLTRWLIPACCLFTLGREWPDRG